MDTYTYRDVVLPLGHVFFFLYIDFVRIVSRDLISQDGSDAWYHTSHACLQ